MARVASAVGEEDLKARIGRPSPARRDRRASPMPSTACWTDSERAFARQREFVSDASHELRTPLDGPARAGRAARPRDRSDSSATARSRRSCASSTGMNRLVDEMLTLAASESTDLVRPRAESNSPASWRTSGATCPCSASAATPSSGTSAGTLNADPEPAAPGPAQPRAQRRRCDRAPATDRRSRSPPAAAPSSSPSRTQARASRPRS